MRLADADVILTSTTPKRDDRTLCERPGKAAQRTSRMKSPNENLELKRRGVLGDIGSAKDFCAPSRQASFLRLYFAPLKNGVEGDQEKRRALPGGIRKMARPVEPKLPAQTAAALNQN